MSMKCNLNVMFCQMIRERMIQIVNVKTIAIIRGNNQSKCYALVAPYISFPDPLNLLNHTQLIKIALKNQINI